MKTIKDTKEIRHDLRDMIREVYGDQPDPYTLWPLVLESLERGDYRQGKLIVTGAKKYLGGNWEYSRFSRLGEDILDL